MTLVVFILLSRKEAWLEEERMALSSVIPRISLGKKNEACVCLISYTKQKWLNCGFVLLSERLGVSFSV